MGLIHIFIMPEGAVDVQKHTPEGTAARCSRAGFNRPTSSESVGKIRPNIVISHACRHEIGFEQKETKETKFERPAEYEKKVELSRKRIRSVSDDCVDSHSSFPSFPSVPKDRGSVALRFLGFSLKCPPFPTDVAIIAKIHKMPPSGSIHRAHLDWLRILSSSGSQG